MEEKWTNEEVKDKMEWEGGVIDLLRWGLLSEQIADPVLADLWAQLEKLEPVIDAIEDVLSSVDVDEEV